LCFSQYLLDPLQSTSMEVHTCGELRLDSTIRSSGDQPDPRPAARPPRRRRGAARRGGGAGAARRCAPGALRAPSPVRGTRRDGRLHVLAHDPAAAADPETCARSSRSRRARRLRPGESTCPSLPRPAGRPPPHRLRAPPGPVPRTGEPGTLRRGGHRQVFRRHGRGPDAGQSVPPAPSDPRVRAPRGVPRRRAGISESTLSWTPRRGVVERDLVADVLQPAARPALRDGRSARAWAIVTSWAFPGRTARRRLAGCAAAGLAQRRRRHGTASSGGEGSPAIGGAPARARADARTVPTATVSPGCTRNLLMQGPRRRARDPPSPTIVGEHLGTAGRRTRPLVADSLVACGRPCPRSPVSTELRHRDFLYRVRHASTPPHPCRDRPVNASIASPTRLPQAGWRVRCERADLISGRAVPV
jgi:hypothetical protein